MTVSYLPTSLFTLNFENTMGFKINSNRVEGKNGAEELGGKDGGRL